MSVRKRFAVMILLYDCDQFILRTIANCAPHVDKIFVSYSPYPWNAYNKASRQEYSNRSNPDILKQSPFFEKTELVSGEWSTEEAQRNEVRELAKSQGFDYLVIQDADEFYEFDDYQKNIAGINARPDFEVYQTPWITFWKNTSLCIVNREHDGRKNTIYSTCPLFAINLNKEVEFESRRVPLQAKSVFKLDGICLHLSYVFTDEEMESKINTWGHAHQVVKNWYKYKWLAWTTATRNLNPLNPCVWKSAVKYEGKLPPELEGFYSPAPTVTALSGKDVVLNYLFDLQYTTRIWAQDIKGKVAKFFSCL